MGASRPIFGEASTADGAAIVLIPVPFDATASYQRGTHRGPAAILDASEQIDLCDRHFGDSTKGAIHLLPADPAIESLNSEATSLCDQVRKHPDAVSLQRINAIGLNLNEALRNQASNHLANQKIVGVIGGDHSCAFALIQAYVDRFPKLGVLHIDAHADLRLAYEGFEWSHASIMRNVIEKTELSNLVQVGIRDYCEEERALIDSDKRISTFFDQDLADAQFAGETFDSQCARIISKLPKEVYISLDIDGLDPTLCPSTGTPVPGGLSFAQLSKLLHTLAKSGKKVVGFDLSEVSPGPSQWDANVGMRVLYKLCGCAAMAKAQ